MYQLRIREKTHKYGNTHLHHLHQRFHFEELLPTARTKYMIQ